MVYLCIKLDHILWHVQPASPKTTQISTDYANRRLSCSKCTQKPIHPKHLPKKPSNSYIKTRKKIESTTCPFCKIFRKAGICCCHLGQDWDTLTGSSNIRWLQQCAYIEWELKLCSVYLRSTKSTTFGSCFSPDSFWYVPGIAEIWNTVSGSGIKA